MERADVQSICYSILPLHYKIGLMWLCVSHYKHVCVHMCRINTSLCLEVWEYRIEDV